MSGFAGISALSEPKRFFYFGWPAVGRLRLADTDSGKSAGSDEEHEWLTELCRAGRAGAEPTDSDDD